MLIAITRTAFLYLTVIAAIRLMGKRQIGELEPSELVVAIMISELAAVPMQEAGVPLVAGIVPILTLIGLEIIMSGALLKSVRLRRLVCGVPSILVDKGVILQNELKKNRLTVDELIEELRLQDVLDISTVQYAILETNGKLSVVLYAAERPATAGQNAPPDSGLPVILINDGRTLTDNLLLRGLNEGWIERQLRERGVTRVEDVFLLMVDERSQIYFLPKDAS